MGCWGRSSRGINPGAIGDPMIPSPIIITVGILIPIRATPLIPTPIIRTAVDDRIPRPVKTGIEPTSEGIPKTKTDQGGDHLRRRGGIDHLGVITGDINHLGIGRNHLDDIFCLEDSLLRGVLENP